MAGNLNVFSHLPTVSTVVRHLVSQQRMHLFIINRRKELAEQCFNVVSNVHLWRNFPVFRMSRTVHLIVTRDNNVSEPDVILGFDLNGVQTYCDASAVFCAFPNVVFTKRMRRLVGTTLGSNRVSKFVARGHIFRGV